MLHARQNALPLTKADGVRCCVGKLWKGCWSDCAIRTFTYPLCHWTNHMLVRRAIRKKYGLQEDPACPDSYAVCCCFPCALVQEANELRQHGADIRDRRHVATVNRSTPKTPLLPLRRNTISTLRFMLYPTHPFPLPAHDFDPVLAPHLVILLITKKILDT